MNTLASAAQREIGSWLATKLRERFPDAMGTLSELQAFVTAECGRFGYPDAIRAEPPKAEGKPCSFVLRDPLQAMLLAASISAANKK